MRARICVNNLTPVNTHTHRDRWQMSEYFFDVAMPIRPSGGIRDAAESWSPILRDKTGRYIVRNPRCTEIPCLIIYTAINAEAKFPTDGRTRIIKPTVSTNSAVRRIKLAIFTATFYVWPPLDCA